jgi:hypothetical protein
MIKFTRALILAPILAATVAAAALPAVASDLPYYAGGAVGSNGAISYGSGFSVQRTGVGTYVVTYPTSSGFQSLPVVTVTPWGVNGHVATAILSSIGGLNGGCQFTVQLTDRVNKLHLVDNAFQFTLIAS